MLKRITLALLCSAAAWAQITPPALTQSTLTSNASAANVALTLSFPFPFVPTGTLPGMLYVDSEAMTVVSASLNLQQVTVQRGARGTTPAMHYAGAVVFSGGPGQFIAVDKIGACDPNSPQLLNVADQKYFTCTAGSWVSATTAPGGGAGGGLADPGANGLVFRSALDVTRPGVIGDVPTGYLYANLSGAPSPGASTPATANVLKGNGALNGVVAATPGTDYFNAPSQITLSGDASGTANATTVNKINGASVPQLQSTLGASSAGKLIPGQGTYVPTNYTAYGDSITAGQNASGTCNSSAGLSFIGCLYPALIEFDLRTTAVNRGISGSMACDVANTQIFPNDRPAIDFNTIYSLQIGTNDAFIKGVGAYEAITSSCRLASLAWLSIPSTSKVYSQNSLVTAAGTWTNDTTYQTGIGKNSQTNGSTLTFPITVNNGVAYAWYRQLDGSGGTFTYAVDGGSTNSVSVATTPAISTFLSGTAGVGLIRISGLTNGAHTVVFTVTSATGAGNNVLILGMGTPSPIPYYSGPRVYNGGVMRRQNDAAAAATLQYNADSLADVNVLQGDGLPVYFVPTRNYLCTSLVGGNCVGPSGVLDMTVTAGDPHPINQGHLELKQAYEAYMQVTPSLQAIPPTIMQGLTPCFGLQDTPGDAVISWFGEFTNFLEIGINRNPCTGAFSNTGRTSAQMAANVGDSTRSVWSFYTSATNNSAPVRVAQIGAGLSVGTTTDPGVGSILATGSVSGFLFNLGSTTAATCAAGIRGQIQYTAAAPGALDIYQVCSHLADNTYAWRPFPDLSGTTGSIGGALTVGACDSGTATVTGATTGMVASASPVTYPGDGYVYQAYVSAADTVTVKLCGLIIGTPTSSVYNVRVSP